MTRDRSLDIAVTGISARFPGCTDIAGWWSALTDGRVLTTRYSRATLIAAGVSPQLIDDPDYVPVRGHLANAEHFDNGLFLISPREAELMDPQHRLMLEVAWAALEDAAVAPLDVGPRTAVFASATGSGYLRAIVARKPLDPATLDDLVHGTEPDFMASRIAYKLGLTGPAIAVQTACSSSLVAVHLAVQSLLNGDCDQALVVAAGLDYPQAGYLYLPGGVNSPSGRCRPFDEGADGVVGGSGAAGVVLRRLSDAPADGPEPYGVILGSAVTNDGARRLGYYTPSGAGQEAVIQMAIAAAAVPADSIGYLETHGTGTSVGDPIEWSAASSALRGLGARPHQVSVGAVKANIGHLDAAAGLAGLIKALLVLKHGVIPPLAGFTRPNPLLEVDGSPLAIRARTRVWTEPRPRRAGVSAFGIGGTNAHVVVEEAPDSTHRSTRRVPAPLVVLSAADKDALARTARRLAEHLTATDHELADVAYTLATGRAALPERLAVAGRTSAEIADRLRSGAGVVAGRRPATGSAPLVFLFAGQGSQDPGMARGYASALPGFTEALDRCLDAFEPELRTPVRRALFDPEFPGDELNETALAQPALFCLGWAAATALVALGIRPVAVTGHSLGEVTAACVAGALELPQAASFVATRGRAMQACGQGAMLALGCDAETARRLLAEANLDLDVASVNGPDSCVLAGPADAIDAIDAVRSREGQLFTRPLRTTRAFHSRLIEPALAPLAAALSTVRLHPLTVPHVSNMDGSVAPKGATVSTAMFVEQARRPVRFDLVLSSIHDTYPGAVALEIGPGRSLSALAEAAGIQAVALHDPRADDEAEAISSAIGSLWTLGHPIAPAGGGRRIHLPGYAFAGPRWVAPEAAALDAHRPPATSGYQTAGAQRLDPAEVLRRAWTEVLGYDDLTNDSDFFLLGGDSLLITRLARRVNLELDIRVPVRAMLASRTLGRQAALVIEQVACAADVRARAGRPAP